MAGVHALVARGGLRVDILGGNFEAVGGSNASASYQLTSGGSEQRTLTPPGSTVTLGQWLRRGVGSQFEVRATPVGGASPLTTGTINTWQSLSTSRSWLYSQSGTGAKGGTFLIEIRDATTLAVLDSANVTLGASVGV